MIEPSIIVAQELANNAAQIEILRCSKALGLQLRHLLESLAEDGLPKDHALLLFNQRLQPVLQAANLLRELNYYVTTVGGCGHNQGATNGGPS